MLQADSKKNRKNSKEKTKRNPGWSILQNL